MKIRQIESVEPGRENLKMLSNSIWRAVSVTIERWRRLKQDPLFVVLFVWALLFLLAAAVNVLV